MDYQKRQLLRSVEVVNGTHITQELTSRFALYEIHAPDDRPYKLPPKPVIIADSHGHVWSCRLSESRVGSLGESI